MFPRFFPALLELLIEHDLEIRRVGQETIRRKSGYPFIQLPIYRVSLINSRFPEVADACLMDREKYGDTVLEKVPVTDGDLNWPGYTYGDVSRFGYLHGLLIRTVMEQYIDGQVRAHTRLTDDERRSIGYSHIFVIFESEGQEDVIYKANFERGVYERSE